MCTKSHSLRQYRKVMTMHTLVAFTIILTIVSCSDNSLTDFPEVTPVGLLEAAYEKQSTELLLEFFEQWHQNIKPKTDAQLAQESDTIQATYAIFQNFYDPFNLSKFGDPEVGNDFYASTKYLIVQNEVYIRFANETTERSVTNFRPFVCFENAKVIYLREDYAELLNQFLSEELEHDEILKRLVFLNTYTKIVHGHWFGWHLITHPEISGIEFNSDLTQADVYFRIVYEGGDANFRKQDRDWKMTSSRMTWIE